MASGKKGGVKTFRLMPQVIVERSEAINEMARQYAGDDENEQAERLFEQSLTSCEFNFHVAHPQTVETLNKYGRFCYDHLKDFGKAREKYEKAIKLCDELYKKRGNRQTASVLCNLGECYWQQGELEAAKPLYERALEIRRAKLKKKGEVLVLLQNLQLLGRLMHELGEEEEAAKYIMESKTGLEEMMEEKGMTYNGKPQPERTPTAVNKN